MVDYIKINVKAGKGGKGAVSFQTSRSRKKGPPDGGDGGDGGNVYLEVSKDLSTLLPYRYKKNFTAGDGKNGGKNNRKGAVGEDTYLPVPAGCRVSDQKGTLIADLTNVGEKVMVTRGGRGGRGNGHIKKSEFRDQAPPAGGQGSKIKKQKSKAQSLESSMWEWFEEGEKGQEISLTLELKLLAGGGLIGLPNAGKSTLLSKLTAATPEIGDYPFTTIVPNLGVMTHKGRELVIADVPGLIEGASQGKGLGDLFLRHIERTKLLVHLVSAESENPKENIDTVNYELAAYSRNLMDVVQIYVLTKIDTLDKRELKNKVNQLQKKGIKVILTSSVTGEGLDSLKDEIISKSK